MEVKLERKDAADWSYRGEFITVNTSNSVMEVKLERKDAADWSYRGEGAANIVLAYTGSSPAFIGKVTRIAKKERNGSPKCDSNQSVLTEEERLLWRDVQELVASPTKEIAEQIYTQLVMSPLLGPKHVDAGMRVPVAREFLECVEKNVIKQRPPWRVDVSTFDMERDSVIIMSDHSLFPGGVLGDGSCISVEIKPKCGFLPLSKFMAEGNSVKRSTTRFRMHQILKLREQESSEDGEKKPVAVGPWGGQEGFLWDDGVHSTVKQLVIAHGAGIDSIQVEYDRKGTSVWSQIHGGNGGMKTTVKLDCPDEFLTSVHGYYGSLDGWGPVFVRSLTFRSNKKTYGPFGVEQGTYFSFPMSGGKIVGFHGKSGWYLDAIGIYLKPLQKQKTSKALVQSKSYVTNGTENISYTMMQGAGNGFDILVAVKQKDDFGKFSTQNSLEYSSGGTSRKDDFGSPLPSKLSRQISREFSDSESNKNDDFGSLLPSKLSTPISRELSDAGSNKTTATERVPSKTEGVIVHGPWGGVGGFKFDDGTYTGIRQIHLSRHVGIASIRVQYDRDGQAIWGSKHGKGGGFKSDKIIFDYPYEILTRVTGTYGPLMYMGPNIIRSLTFYTNKGKHGPFGEEQGPTFTNKIDEGKIIGFHGREGFLLDAIGVHVLEGTVKPAKHHLSDAIKQAEADVAEIDNSPWSNKLVAARPGQTEEVVCGVIKEPAPCGPGPWGGDGGRPWDDGVFSGIKQIFITRAEAMCSIQIEYDRNGQSVWSIKHGGNGGTATHRVKLQCPHEVLVCLSGYYGPIGSDGNSPKVIKSLTFHTSRGNYGPFGEEIGTFFTSTTTEGKVVGFHGRSSAYMDAIGVHMQHWLGNHRSPKPSSLFKIFS